MPSDKAYACPGVRYAALCSPGVPYAGARVYREAGKANSVYTSSPEELLEQITQIEADIQELLDYNTEVNLHKASVTGWKRFLASLKMMLVARQIRRHLVYLKLQRRIAQNSYDQLQKPGGQKLV